MELYAWHGNDRGADYVPVSPGDISACEKRNRLFLLLFPARTVIVFPTECDLSMFNKEISALNL